MTAGLVAALVLLVGAKLRVRPAPRVPTNSRAMTTSRQVGGGAMIKARVCPRRATIDAIHVATWCDELARAVSTGSTLVAAIRQVEPAPECGAAIGSIRLALERGAALQDACSIECGSHDLQLALTVLRACAAQGGSAAEPLSRTAATLRGRAADAADRLTQSAQARLSATVMTILPACMLVVLLASSGAVRGFVASPAGLMVVAFGAVLNTSGWRWMKRLIEGNSR